MEDATITTNEPKDQMYQQGKYPSIVDTDDLVFELGKQTVQNINNDKIIEQLVNTTKQAEANTKEILEKQTFEEIKYKSIEESNRLYEKNNTELSDTIVNLRNEIHNLKSTFSEKESELNEKISKLKARKMKPVTSKSKIGSKQAING